MSIAYLNQRVIANVGDAADRAEEAGAQGHEAALRAFGGWFQSVCDDIYELLTEYDDAVGNATKTACLQAVSDICALAMNHEHHMDKLVWIRETLGDLALEDYDDWPPEASAYVYGENGSD